MNYSVVTSLYNAPVKVRINSFSDKSKILLKYPRTGTTCYKYKYKTYIPLAYVPPYITRPLKINAEDSQKQINRANRHREEFVITEV